MHYSVELSVSEVHVLMLKAHTWQFLHALASLLYLCKYLYLIRVLY